MKKIYFDNNATTPLDPAVREAMLPYLDDRFGNPSSGHRFGEDASEAVDEARRKIAALINGSPSGIIITSGGTESNNMAIHSAVSSSPEKKHLITSQVEHPSVLKPLQHLQSKGYDLEILPVSEDGGLDLDRLEKAIRPDTALVSLIGANNETGVLWPIQKIGEICRAKSVLFHCDAVQMPHKEDIDIANLPIDYLTLAAHKMHGPKGCGALYAQPHAPLRPLILGAGQERGLRAGTENVAGIVGFAKAAETAKDKLQHSRKAVAGLRDHLENGILEKISGARINGHSQPRLVNTINVSFQNVSAAAVIQDLDERGFAVSAQSACHSGDLDPSHVLTAMNVPDDSIHGTLRISLSRFNTMEETDGFLDLLITLIKKSRSFAAL